MYTYYDKDNMKGKKLSDLKNNEEFLEDALTFLRSKRKNYTEEDLQGMSGEDVVYDVLEHFRIQSTNEMTMAKDYYFIEDNQTSDMEKQAFGRLMYAFDNAEGEGLLDGTGAKIRDYAEGILTAPTTYATALSIPFTGGAGAVAAQGTRQASLMALRGLTKKHIGRAAVVGAIDGAIAGGSTYGVEKIKEIAGKEIGEEYDVNMVNVGAAAVLGGTVSGAASIIGQKFQDKAAQGLAGTIQRGRDKNVKETAAAVEKAEKALRRQMSKEETKLFEWSSMNVLRSIDPKLVEEGMDVKKFILSEDLPDGLIGGLDRGTIKRISAAALDLTQQLRVKPEEGQRITEQLALAVSNGTGKKIFEDVMKEYGLSARQLSAVYAAEVSEAAKVLAAQGQLVSRGGGKVRQIDAKKFRDQLDDLYDRGMSAVSGREATELTTAQLESLTGATGRIWRNFKKIEDFRRAFMTSQPATTMRNNIFGVAMTGIDYVDQIFMAGIKAVRGEREAAASTFKNRSATMAYLVKDQYVAEALTTMLSQEAPEKMSRVFLNAAQAEAGVVRNSGLARAGNAVNVLNTMSDHVFKRAVIASTIDRELGKLGDPRLGKSVMEMLEKGTLSQLPDEILDKAMSESFAFTFQRKFGGKDASPTNKAAHKAIKFIHDTGLTIAIPFPRYIASQAKFISDYTGLTVARRGMKNASDEEYAKMMTGAAMFGGAYMIQRDNVANDREWYEGEGYDGQIYNAQAAMGPAAPMSWFANNLGRMLNGDETRDHSSLARDFAKLAIGTEFRPQGGLVDKIFRAADSEDWTPVFEVVGDYLSSITYPAAVVKDFYGQFDPRSSFFPETRDATNQTYRVEIPLIDVGFDLRMSFFQRMTRQLPDFNVNEMELPEGVSPDMARSMLEFFGNSTRTQFQTMRDPSKGDTGYDTIRFDIFGDGPVRMYNPLLKQATGLVGVPPKNALQRELTKLQLDPFKLYNPYREKNTAVSTLTEALLQGNLAANAANYISKEEYQNKETKDQKVLLESFVNAEIRETKKIARKLLQNAKGSDFNAYIRGEVNALSRKETRNSDIYWESVRGRLGFEGLSFREAREAIKQDTDYDEKERQAKDTALHMIYINGQKEVSKILRSASR